MQLSKRILTARTDAKLAELAERLNIHSGMVMKRESI